MPITLTGLYCYPIKSGAPLAGEMLSIAARGPCLDRRWMAISPAGRFLTGRRHPRLCLIQSRGDGGDGLHLSAAGMPSLQLEPDPSRPRLEAFVWKSLLSAQPASREADDWLSRFLGENARWAHMDAACQRLMTTRRAAPGDEVSLADTSLLLLISQAALDRLNTRLAQPVSMLRFRPNLVIAGCPAHAEDDWQRLRIGELEFDVAKPCTRCILVNVDPLRGEFDPAGEPLRTLKTYRSGAAGIAFGQHLIPRRTGRLRLGDPVTRLA